MNPTITTSTPSSWIDRLLGLREFQWAEPGTSFDWLHPLPAWGWAAIFLAAFVLSAWSYRRLAGTRRVRGVLTVTRCLLITLLAALLAGPAMVLRQEIIEPDTLLVMVDRSASMRIQDTAKPGEQPPLRITREERMQSAILEHAELFGPEKLGKDRRVVWLGFNERLYTINRPQDWLEQPLDPPNGGTKLRMAIEQALDKASGTPISGIVLFTDGRTPENTGPDLVRTLQREVAAVFPVPIGDPTGGSDLGIAHVAAPESAFAKDTIPIDVFLDHDATDADHNTIVIQLIDTTTGQVLDERQVTGGSTNQPVRLVGESESIGHTQWQARVDWATRNPGSSTSHRQDLVPDNNTRGVSVRIVDRPIRVLYVEGIPRWEYRYLHSVLTREQSIESSTLLISADRDFPQEGDVPITRFPQTPQELLPYDVVIIGDVPTTFFSSQQLEMLKDHVASQGLGVIWIGGPNHTPDSYLISPLASLLPMRPQPGEARVQSVNGPINISVTPLATSLGIMHLADNQPIEADDHSGWPSDLPPLTWAQDIEPLAPSAEVLAFAENPTGTNTPVVARMRYGAGQSIYVATDETWRWRYGVGDVYFERFWVQLIRMLGRHRLKGSGTTAALTVSTRTVELGDTVVVRLRSGAAAPRSGSPSRVSVHIAQSDLQEPINQASDAQRLGTLDLLPTSHNTSSTHSGQPLQPSYEGLWQPEQPGRLLLSIDDPAISDERLQATIDVIRPDDEMRHPKPDHQRLTQLAQATDGKVIPINNLSTLIDLVPNRAKRTPNDIIEPLWDAPLCFLIIVAMLTVEWLGRKLIRLV